LIALRQTSGNTPINSIDEHRMDVIKRGTFDTYQSITLQAISGSLGQQKLVAELRGDTKNKVEIDHKVTGPNIIPKDLIEKDKIIKPDGKQIIDIDYED